MECVLPKHQVKLLDGKEYTFRTLPINRKTFPLIEKLESDSTSDRDKFFLMVELTELSLSYDYTKEEVEQLSDSGVLVFSGTNPETKEVLHNIAEAMFPRFKSNEA